MKTYGMIFRTSTNFEDWLKSVTVTECCKQKQVLHLYFGVLRKIILKKHASCFKSKTQQRERAMLQKTNHQSCGLVTYSKQ